ncbi:di-trans,poly-cis-decaprenylcistransferase [Candidatus Woesebacteria bacterium]|nr:di-trans,poly-cis-decaprenylcistransferase [Candidatus Woesebacteria bacterium]
MNQSSNIPAHVAIIMDGNRRWARSHGWEAIRGHEYVVDNVIEPIVDRCIELGISYLTLWAFSTENWERDQREIEGMMQLFRRAFEKKVEDLHKKEVKLQIIGDIDRFPDDIAKNAKRWVEISKDNTKITVSFALNYGGRDELLHAINLLHQKNPSASTFTQEDLEAHLATAGMPDPDLIIRPGGQFRLSGFLPWQSVYSELYFTDILMPEFQVNELNEALQDYSNRQRRFGK